MIAYSLTPLCCALCDRLITPGIAYHPTSGPEATCLTCGEYDSPKER